MFMHNKKLQYTVRVSEPDPVLGTFMLEQFGGPDGELAAAMRYFTQGLGEEDPGRKDLLMDIATEKLSHLEIIGSIVAMLCKGAKGTMAEGSMQEADLYVEINSGGISHTESIRLRTPDQRHRRPRDQGSADFPHDPRGRASEVFRKGAVRHRG